MPSNEEITAALVVLRLRYDYCDRHDKREMHELTEAMLNAAEVIRLAKLEREIAKMSHPDEAS